jgi:hypothetical protein
MRLAVPCWGLAGVAIAACVGPLDTETDPGWIELQLGAAQTVAFDEDDGPLAGVALIVPDGAVTQPTTLHLSVASATQPVFLSVQMQLRSPAVSIEPYGPLFANAVTIELPWYSWGETISSDLVRGWTSPGLDGVPSGLWTVTTATLAGEARVRLEALDGGIYWAGTYEEDPLRSPEESEIVGDPCAAASSDIQACEADASCAPRGCLGDRCGAGPDTATLCRPAATMPAHLGCACRCRPAICQWVR